MPVRTTFGILGGVLLLLIGTPVRAQGGWYTANVTGQIVTSVGTIQYNKPVLLVCGQSKPRVQTGNISFKVGAYYRFENLELQDYGASGSSSGWFRISQSTKYYEVSGCSAPPPTPVPSPQFSFSADQTILTSGQCTTLRWYIAGWHTVRRFDGQLYDSSGFGGNVEPIQQTKQVCPQSTTSYTIDVTFLNGSTQSKTVTVNVSAPPPPPTVPLPPSPTRVLPTIPPPTSVPSPSISFYADPPIINLGDCSTLRWDVENVRAVFWGSEEVAGHDSRVVCPRTATVYVLRVITYSGEVLRTVAVNVRELPPTQVYVPPTAPLPTAYVPLPSPSWTPLPQQVYVPPTSQPIVQVAPQNPSSVLSKQEDNSTVFNKENAGGLLMILGGIALVLRPIIKWLWPGN